MFHRLFPARTASHLQRRSARSRAGSMLAVAAVTSTLLAGATASAQAATYGDSPLGSLDTAKAESGGIRVTGWAWDPNTTAGVSVSIKAGSVTKTVTASGYRTDVAKLYPEAGTRRNYSTLVSVPAGTYSVCATAINVGAGSNTSFGCRTVTVGTTTTTTTTTSTAAPGTVKPDASNTGVPAGRTLRVHEGDLTISTPGTVIDGLDVRGFVKVNAANVTIRNSIIRGRATSSWRALVTSNSDATSVVIEDSELFAAYPSGWIDGIRGWNITARRLDIHHVIDALHLYGNNVTLESSWLHDNLHYTSDPAQNGTPSHDDSIQIQKGSNIRIVGNNISGAVNTGIQFTQDQGVVSNVTITKNWLDGGGCTVNLAEKGRGPFQGVVITDNTFGRTTKHYNCAIISPTTTVLTTARNVFTDGTAALVRRG